METSKPTQYVPKDMISPLTNPEMFDLNALLEFMHTNDDVNMLVESFAALSRYIVLNESNISVIITYNCLYDKIGNLISNCPSKKADTLFIFLLALMHKCDGDNKRNNLIAYAKNMIRSSGCLGAMCKLFTNCMMHQDTWRSLCRCLAEICSNVEANQTYCTHLVPTCVQRCSHSNMEVLLVLQSLLQNHERNANLFIECNGISIFRREFLRHNICLQVLNTFVMSSKQAVELIKNTEVWEHLSDFLHLYGPQSQLGQWARIIMYHLSKTEGTSKSPAYKQSFINKPEKTIIGKPSEREFWEDLTNVSNTTTHLENVVNEMIQCGLLSPQHKSKPKYNLVHPNLFLKQNPIIRQRTRDTSLMFKKGHLRKDKLKSSDVFDGRRSKQRDLSFSFLYGEKNRYSNTTMTAKRKLDSDQTESSESVNIKKGSSILHESRIMGDNYTRHVTPDLSIFAPKYVSTPKKQHNTKRNKSVTRFVGNSIRSSISNTISKHDHKRGIKGKNKPSKAARVNKNLERSTIEIENKHRSISGWFFDAVNESCTTLIKKVKDIFKPKHSSEESKARFSTLMSNNSPSCSYSFTNYMRKRDTILKNEQSFNMEISDSCNTCNDTVVLKQKLVSDAYLKQTVRKLKVGINLYGCDFKKISKQLWPQDTYMTPAVLYNLYRKLIIK